MTNDLSRQSHALFVLALEIEAPAREAFVAKSCAGNAALEARVRRLMAALDRSTGFLEEPALGTRHPHAGGRSMVEPGAIRAPGYRVERVLGIGGMATVYEAVQNQPERTVALKVMSRGLGSVSAVRRFKYETEVLGRLHHPGIAQIFEAGTCDDGTGRSLPFFAMELVRDARTLTDHARDHRLSLRDRLELFASVCDAVQHGHQIGVIHRDLKPGNILVDAEGRAKIIDFGIARPVDTERADITRRSDIGHLIGTLHYMSPEQCDGKGNVDVRTDVYALGVILFQLVADRLPHDLSRSSITEAARVIAQEYPARLGLLNAAARGDLEAIVAMAMEKEPARRYSGAGALAADVRRYLNDQPIDARPATTVYQLRKFARRHRSLVTAVAAAFGTLLVGIAATARMAYVASVAKDAAVQRQGELEQVADYQQSQLSGIDVAEMGKRLRAMLMNKTREALAREAAAPERIEKELTELERILRGVSFTSLALGNLDESVLERSHEAINKQFADQPVLRARLLQTLAGTMNTLGLSSRAEPVLGEALRIRRDELGDDHLDTMTSQHSMGSLLMALGRYGEALEILRDVYERRGRVLGPEDRATLATGTSLGGALRYAGDLDGAERVWTQTYEAQRRVLGEDDPATLRSLNNVGVIHAVRGDFVGAERFWRELLGHRRRLLERGHPELRATLGNLSAVLQEQGKLSEARPLAEESLETARRVHGDDHDNTLFAMSTLGSLLRDLKEWERAEPVLRECVERRERMVGPEHSDTLVAKVALASMWVERRRGGGGTTDAEMKEAEEMIRGALAVQRRELGDGHVETLESMNALSELLCDTGRGAEAEPLSGEAVERSRRLHPSGHWSIGQHRSQQGRALAGMKRWREAESAMLEGHAILLETLGANDLRTRRAGRGVVELYEGWEQAEPGAGHGASAARWREAAPGGHDPRGAK